MPPAVPPLLRKARSINDISTLYPSMYTRNHKPVTGQPSQVSVNSAKNSKRKEQPPVGQHPQRIINNTMVPPMGARAGAPKPNSNEMSADDKPRYLSQYGNMYDQVKPTEGFDGEPSIASESRMITASTPHAVPDAQNSSIESMKNMSHMGMPAAK